MTAAARGQLLADLKRDEGMRLRPYRDTVGKLTIGYGRNLDDRGITAEEAEMMLQHDLATAERECAISFDWFAALDDARQSVLVNMAFNLGLSRLRGFGVMLACVREGDYAQAAEEMLRSKWAKQVGGRADRLAAQMRYGRLG